MREKDILNVFCLSDEEVEEKKFAGMFEYNEYGEVVMKPLRDDHDGPSEAERNGQF